ncbi:ribonuclease D [Alkanindiges sp. WGS2144]|uniref:ribonuclease D n=1 Tax=Alkanindiges sp. WGS2144 TaxID=3366808 RepID=UPI0037515D82
MFRYIAHQDQLNDLYASMAATDIYALDTEFIKVNTLRPCLGLLQINVDGKVFLLDGKTLDLSDLWLLIFNARLNVLHACGEDLDLIHYYADQKPLGNVFDTQVGLAFLGHGLQVSYQQALSQELDIQIDKGETRSDWLARPLRPEQLQYAANDVTHLPALASTVRQQLQQKHLWDYVLEDCVITAQEIATEQPLTELYLEVANFRHNRKQLAQLQQLCIWREQIARATDQPRSFILKNSTLIDLLDKQPMNAYQLQRIKDIRPNILREHGKTILDLLHYLPESVEWPARLPRPLRYKNNELLNQVHHYIETVSHNIQVPAEVLLRKKWLNAMINLVALKEDESQLSEYLLGWRYDLLTRPILSLLSQQQQILAAEMSSSDLMSFPE